ncbi:class I SAM-dependent methyltransferase [Patescibacteria group bacterium]|nr:class I SAM-dependent methyltransferase [Patescibacteria group bacterium]MBU1922015.1 class I SAM-dependent methyltransferase [Patescibacteria group bacterium]
MNIKLRKLKLQKEYCQDGSVLDIGFAALPNPYLKDAMGLDICLPKDTPPSYGKVIKCNLNFEKIPLENGSLDNIIAGDVIEHLENPSFFLREVNRILRQNGHLILCTPQANDWWATLHNWFFRKWINDPDRGEHLQNWTILDMTRLLKKNGFQISKMEGFYMHFPKINLKIRVKSFPILSWQVFYIANKIKEPDASILVKVDKEWRSV